MSARVPERVVAEGREWDVSRAWPVADPRADVPVEARRAGEARGGHWHPDAGVRLLPRGEDPRLPALAAVARAGTVVSHRPGKRAVVRLREGGGFAKAVRPGRAAEVIASHRRAERFRGALRLPRIVPHDFGAGDVVCFSPLTGTTFDRLGASGDVVEWAAAWRAWERAWTQTIASADTTGLPVHDAQDEARVLLDWAARADASAEGGDRVGRAAAAIASALAEAAGPATALAHRDLHDKQLLWSGGDRLGLIDLDTCAAADPALDLGNLAAHVGLAVRLGRWAPDRARVALTAVDSAAASLGVTDERLSAWRLAARCRIACVHLLRLGSRRAARDDLERLVRLVDGRGIGRAGAAGRGQVRTTPG